MCYYVCDPFVSLSVEYLFVSLAIFLFKTVVRLFLTDLGKFLFVFLDFF